MYRSSGREQSAVSFGTFRFVLVARGRLTIWKLGHCPRARGQ
ncbi:unnamed protein product [Staurois parvus]|uniref:Uncharacterized protein n=1 Tax=Staurois parvus TaxID=386267 RepID=A0ABN9DUE6_9NEOB|nr:unnamed protein product [Staurois parvus]